MANVVRVKICGITNVEDALAAAKEGAWAIGFIFYNKSPRYVSASRAKKIIDQLPPFVTPVGVFVNQNEKAVRDICQFTGITTVQFHGEEEPQYCSRFKNIHVIKAFKIHDAFNFDIIHRYGVNAFLFDTFKDGQTGGTGSVFNWDLLKTRSFKKPFILSGGLNQENLPVALEIKPYAVDVSSGVESKPGIKNHRLVKQFLDIARSS